METRKAEEIKCGDVFLHDGCERLCLANVSAPHGGCVLVTMRESDYGDARGDGRIPLVICIKTRADRVHEVTGHEPVELQVVGQDDPAPSKSNTSRQMRCDIDLDWCTYTCPCGESLCTRFQSDGAITAWKEQHKPHTDGSVLEHTTPNGCRAWGGPVPDEVKEFR